MVFACGIWFDGQSTQRRSVQVEWDDEHLRLTAMSGEELLRISTTQLQPSERWQTGPVPVQLGVAGTLWLEPATEASTAAAWSRLSRPSLPARWVQSWFTVAWALAMLVALLVWFDRQGAGLVAQAALTVIPRSVDQKVGDAVMHHLLKQDLRDSEVPDERRKAIQQRFESLCAQAAPGLPLKLSFHRSRRGFDFNAFALPNGHIVLLDALVLALNDDEVLAVLAHEVGHVWARHGMRRAAASFGLVATASVVMGDFSDVAATAIAVVQGLQYSQAAEREADAFASAQLSTLGLWPSAWDGAIGKIQVEQARHPVVGVPTWLSTHPPTESRLSSKTPWL